MQQNYSEVIKDHYHHPRNTGKISDRTHVIEQINPMCGDETKVYIKIKKGVIENISHETRGCMIAVASASVVSEYALGKKLSEIKKLDEHNVAKLLNVIVSPSRASCARLILSAVSRAD